MKATLLALLVVAGAAACGSSSPSNVAATSDSGVDAAPSGACGTRAEADAYACAEAQFWDAFRHVDLPARKSAEATLTDVIAAIKAPTDVRGMSLMHFRIGQLRLAMSLENDQRDYVLHSNTEIVGEFDAATALDSYGGIIAPWKDAMQIATAAVLGDWGDAVPLADRGFANVPLNPMGNTLSLSGTTIGFPLSTGVPQKTAMLLDAWSCSGVAWCTVNTDHASYARPGLGYHFAEAYARVGDRNKASAYLQASLSAPGADVWPYRSIAQTAASDVDAFLAKFSKLGNDGSAFNVVYANQPFGCLFCHAAPP